MSPVTHINRASYLTANNKESYNLLFYTAKHAWLANCLSFFNLSKSVKDNVFRKNSVSMFPPLV